MKNLHIIKLGGMLTLVSFLFLPVAGCGSLTFSGIDLMKMDSISVTVRIFAILAMLCALVIVFVPDKTVVFFSAIGGFIALLIAYFSVKSKMDTGDSFGISNAFELKSGSYLSIIGLVVSAVASKSKNELLGSQPAGTPGTGTMNEQAPNFCPSCGTKTADVKPAFCANCGAKL